ncbi:hypothetical protein ACGYK5_17785 [Sulfitobacter sp. 1A16787]|uniref:hypothetical protein n=1 Tax=Sulfitobacter sp. 1A16787 TaxID=3368571 RepID=UPI003744E0D8
MNIFSTQTAPAANANAAPAPAMRRFEAGKTYTTRSVGDHNCIISVTVVRRTAKTIITDEGKRLRVSPGWRGEAETVKPWGTYSMCPVVSA